MSEISIRGLRERDVGGQEKVPIDDLERCRQATRYMAGGSWCIGKQHVGACLQMSKRH